MLSDLSTKTKRNIRKHLEFEGIYYLDYGDANTHMLLCLATLLCPVFHDPMDCSPSRPLCPWDFPGRNTGVGSHSLLQGSLLTQGMLLHWQMGSLPLSHLGSPNTNIYL